MRSIILALSIVLAACATPGPTPPPLPTDVYAGACANLAAIGCQEGAKPNCAAVMQRAQESAITDLHPACLATATSKEAARACGSVRCP